MQNHEPNQDGLDLDLSSHRVPEPRTTASEGSSCAECSHPSVADRNGSAVPGVGCG